MLQNSDQSILDILQARGYIQQMTDDQKITELLKKPATIYIGFDCTADSLHAGSLLQIMVLRIFQQYGHKPIILLGGATSQVGDPSGKDNARQMLSKEQILKNKESISQIFKKFLNFGDGSSDAVIVDNSDWLSDINYIDFLRDFGKHFSINRMLNFDSVKLRLDRQQSLSFLEFNYMLLQAYDFVELHKRYDCLIQIGGSDQWGNIVNGIELNRRLGLKEIYGITTPLLTTASGNKMGKTADGAVWLNEDKLSSYDYWQYFRNVNDKDVGKFLKLFTELSFDYINELENLPLSEINNTKKILATKVTELCHGNEAAMQAEKTAIAVFEKGKLDENLPIIEINLVDYQEKLA
ncbi:MAG: tyrosine--tRNA ligase, partial [Pseudomonadota bacterium]